MAPADLFRLVSLAAIWGGSFLFMRWVVPALGAVPTAFGRVALAAIGLFVALVAMRVPRDFKGRLPHSLFLGVVNSGVPFLMFAFAAQVLPAGYSAILNATTPMMGIAIGALAFGEPVDMRKLAGVALGMSGVAALAGAGPVTPTLGMLAGVLACLVATACYAVAGFLTRRWITRHGGLDSRVVAFGSQLGAVAVMALCLVVQAATEGVALGAMDTRAWVSLGALGLVCTSFAYVLYFRLLAAIGPVRAMSVTFLIPAFGVLWGWLFLDEALSLAHAAGGGMIALAMWLVLRPGRR